MSNYCKECDDLYSVDVKTDIYKQKKEIFKILISGVILAISLIFEFLFKSFVFSQMFAALVVFISGYEIIKEGILDLLKKKININLLMGIAAIGSFIIGHGGEGASLMFLYSLAEFLEEYSKDKSKKSITKLMKLAPDIAVVKKNGSFKEIHTHDVLEGDLIQIKPGETIPIDGIIKIGSTSLNEASLTGESIPTSKKIGDEVYAGTVNCEGYIEFEATKTSDQTLLAKIKNLIEDAKYQKSKTEKFVDEFAKFYTPIIIILSILTMTIPPLIFNQPLNDWIYKGLTLLVISCPCALALATPISVISAITSGSKNGILIKGGKYIEEMKNVQTIAFDKTGTITEGSLEVKDTISYNSLLLNDWFKIVAGLELLSEHPISKAIVKESEKRSIEPVTITNFKAIAGKGVVGEFNNKKYFLGNSALFKDIELKTPEEDVDKMTLDGKTVIIFGNKTEIIGIISLQDKIRDESKWVIKELHERNIKTILISGDSKNTVSATQKLLNIEEVHYELKPDEKQEVIKQKIAKNVTIAMIGDGVNDAPSLALSNVGIAMGGIGSDVSLETADVILMKDDLTELLTFIEISKKTNIVIKENIYFAITVKLIFVFLTFIGTMTLYLAVGIGDLGVTLLVILNALRISKVKKKMKLREIMK